MLFGDIMGELLFFYVLVDIVFVGGSLVFNGGYNLLELVVLGKLVFVGLYLFNFFDIVV